MSHFRGFGPVFVADRDFNSDDTDDRHFRHHNDTSSDFDDTTD